MTLILVADTYVKLPLYWPTHLYWPTQCITLNISYMSINYLRSGFSMYTIASVRLTVSVHFLWHFGAGTHRATNWRWRNAVPRGATTSSKLGVQFLRLGYYYPSTEKIRPVYPVWCSWLHNHTLVIKKLCKKLGVRPNFGQVRTPTDPQYLLPLVYPASHYTLNTVSPSPHWKFKHLLLEAYLVQSSALQPVVSLSLRQTDLGCAPSSDSGLSPSLAQRHGTLSLLIYAPSLTETILRTSYKPIFLS